MASRRHSKYKRRAGSEREAGIAAPIARTRYKADIADKGILAATFILRCENLSAANRAKLWRILRRHAEAEILESRESVDDKGNPCDVPTVLKVWGLPAGLTVLARFVDTTPGIASEIYTQVATSVVAAGSGTLSQSAGKFKRLNAHQQREAIREPQYRQQRERVERESREVVNGNREFFRAVATNAFYADQPAQLAANIAHDDAVREMLPTIKPDIRNGAPPVKPDCGKTVIRWEPLTLAESCDAITYGYQDWILRYALIEQARRDRMRILREAEDYQLVK